MNLINELNLHPELTKLSYFNDLEALKKTTTIFSVKSIIDTLSRVTLLRWIYNLQVFHLENSVVDEINKNKLEFDTFTDQKDPEKSTRRTIYEIRIEQEGDKIRIVYIGTGFLYHMVRRLTGTLLEVGRGERRPEEVLALLNAKDSSLSGFLAPARGLFLREVYYKYSKHADS